MPRFVTSWPQRKSSIANHQSSIEPPPLLSSWLCVRPDSLCPQECEMCRCDNCTRKPKGRQGCPGENCFGPGMVFFYLTGTLYGCLTLHNYVSERDIIRVGNFLRLWHANRRTNAGNHSGRVEHLVIFSASALYEAFLVLCEVVHC